MVSLRTLLATLSKHQELLCALKDGTVQVNMRWFTPTRKNPEPQTLILTFVQPDGDIVTVRAAVSKELRLTANLKHHQYALLGEVLDAGNFVGSTIVLVELPSEDSQFRLTLWDIVLELTCDGLIGSCQVRTFSLL